jgi:hypothetical protein
MKNDTLRRTYQREQPARRHTDQDPSRAEGKALVRPCCTDKSRAGSLSQPGRTTCRVRRRNVLTDSRAVSRSPFARGSKTPDLENEESKRIRAGTKNPSQGSSCSAHPGHRRWESQAGKNLRQKRIFSVGKNGTVDRRSGGKILRER